MTKAHKGPSDIPERGDRCRMRGKPRFVGTLLRYDPDNNWATVAWDNRDGPTVCHRFELQIIAA